MRDLTHLTDGLEALDEISDVTVRSFLYRVRDLAFALLSGADQVSGVSGEDDLDNDKGVARATASVTSSPASRPLFRVECFVERSHVQLYHQTSYLRG